MTGLTLLLHLAVAGRYGPFRNELYFIICGRHPAFGYADQPPLVPLLAAATQMFGPDPWLLRLPAAIAAAALVPLTASFARLLGGGPLAQAGAAAAAALAPGLAGLTAMLTTSTFEPLAWTGCAYFLVRAVLRDDRRALLWAGAVAGLAAQAKYGIALWGLGLAGGLLLTAARRLLAWRQLWAGLLVALLLAAPSLIWQSLQGWPFFEIVSSPVTSGKDYIGSPLRFVLGLMLEMNPVLAPLWLVGAAAPFATVRLRALRFLPIALVIAAAIDVAGGGKSYYLYPAFPTLFALGAAACSDLNRAVGGLWLAASTVCFAVAAPVVLPILDPPQLLRYLDGAHLRPRPIEAAGIGAPLTQVFSDQMGWPALERTVATLYRALPEPERGGAAIMASNYGEAAAIDLYGAADRLPPAISGENQYFLWGPRGFDGSVIIHVGGDPERWKRICHSVEIAATFGDPYAMPYESGRPIFICRGLRVGLGQLWPRFRRFQ